MTNYVNNMVNTIKEEGFAGQEKKDYIARKKAEIIEKMEIIEEADQQELFNTIIEEIEMTFEQDIATQIWEEAPENEKSKKVGPLSYVSIKTGYKEVTFLTNYRETAVTVVIDQDMNIKKIVTSGKGSRSNTDRLKMMGEEEFTAILNGTSKAKKDKDLQATYYVK